MTRTEPVRAGRPRRPQPWSVATLLVLALAAPLRAQEQPVRDFTLPSAIDDSVIRLADYSGKVVLINWWRSTCSICRDETPALVALYAKHREKGLEIIGVSDDQADAVSDLPKFIESAGITWRVGLNDQAEFMREIRPLGSGSTPCNYIVSRDGRIRFLGEMNSPAEDWKQIEDAIVAELAKPVPDRPPIEPRALTAAPPLEGKDLEGKTVKLSQFAGQPVVVHFFNHQSASWAGKALAEMHDEYSERGLKVLGVNPFDASSSIESYAEDYGARYPVLSGYGKARLAWLGGRTSAYGIFFVDRDGLIRKEIRNSISDGIERSVLRKCAARLLAKRPSSERVRQWASGASASSSYEAEKWSAARATGGPNAEPGTDDEDAWAPKSKDGTEEWLELTFTVAVRPLEIRIHESVGPGGVRRIQAQPQGTSEWKTLWEGESPSESAFRVFSPTLVEAKYSTTRVRLTINTSPPNWQEVDAVLLVGERSPR
jgi:peroxiredoxin